jgi:hypothetical protein
MVNALLKPRGLSCGYQPNSPSSCRHAIANFRRTCPARPPCARRRARSQPGLAAREGRSADDDAQSPAGGSRRLRRYGAGAHSGCRRSHGRDPGTQARRLAPYATAGAADTEGARRGRGRSAAAPWHDDAGERDRDPGRAWRCRHRRGPGRTPRPDRNRCADPGRPRRPCRGPRCHRQYQRAPAPRRPGSPGRTLANRCRLCARPAGAQ